MLMFFGFPPASGPTIVQEGPRHEFKDIIGEKNVEFHATFDDEEPQQLIRRQNEKSPRAS